MNNRIIRSSDEAVIIKAEVELRAEKLKQEILESASDYTGAFGTFYYFSESGDDANDGLSPESPKKTLGAASELPLLPGDCVVFKRGDTFRGYLKAKRGVVYSAYGDGKKPLITNSIRNYADASLWEETEVKNVYKLTTPITNDVGIIVFNEGEAWSEKRIKGRPEFPEGGLENLDCDLCLWHDIPAPVDETGYVYLRSDKGNPGERYSSIEIGARHGIIGYAEDTTFDNLAVKYGAAHGICGGSVNGLTVRNCELAWIGGSWFRTDTLSRFGNAIEIYGGCRNFVCDHNYIYQIYDAGITQQLKNGKGEIYMCDITYSYNLIEDTSYSVEYFLDPMLEKDLPEDGKQPTRYTKNFEIVGNIMRRSGFGWGHQRPDKASAAHIKGWTQNSPVMNHTVHGNIFDDSRFMQLHVGALSHKWMPKMWDNIYISGTCPTSILGRTGGLYFDGSESVDKKIEYDADFERAFDEILCERDSIVVLEK